jgi:bifunctional non-homologous end joining protein LigD
LLDRKHDLKSLIRHSTASRLLYADHIEGSGKALFERVCELDLEGVVAKYNYGAYVGERERSTSFKVRNGNSCELACEYVR